MFRFNLSHVAASLAVFGVLFLASCASNGKPAAEKSPEGERKPVSTASRSTTAGFPRISLQAGAHQTLGEAFRYLGETFGGGAALIGGLEDDPAPADGLGTTGFVSGLERIAGHYGGKIQVTPHYVFIYPEGYDVLESISLADKVDKRFHTTRASFAIGAGTDLYNVFALLSASLQLTIIADNRIAETWCGEIFLDDAPVWAIVEAILKTARLAPDAFVVESTSEYLFIRSTDNQSRAPSCLNVEALTAAQADLLASPISMRLPETGPELTFQSVASPLAKVLPALSNHLGIPVTATEGMGNLPVNLSVFQNVSVETALDLLVRQWLLPRYGYRLDGGGLQFCER
jgi:hypothetical protein